MERHKVFNLLITFFMISLVERPALLQVPDGQTDNGKAQTSLKDQLLLSSSVISGHPVQGDTRKLGANNYGRLHSERKLEHNSKMENPTAVRIKTTSTPVRMRITEKARGLALAHHWNKLRLHAQHKSRSNNAREIDSFTHKKSKQILRHTNSANVQTRFEDNRSTDMSPSRIESIQSVPLREATQSYHQARDSNFGSANVQGCSTFDCNRQLCPWDYEADTDPNRSPITVWVASCKRTTCDFNQLGFWTQVMGAALTGCDPVIHEMQVVKDNTTISQAFPVACVCRYRRGVHHLTQKSSDAQSNSFAGILKTGPMTHTVKLSELPEVIDGIKPEITNRDLPVIHRNRKLEKHHGNKSSDQLKRKPKRQQPIKTRDVKLEGIQ